GREASSAAPRKALVEREERLEHGAGILDLRIVADVGQLDGVGMGDELAVARDHVRARHRVDGAVDDAERDLGLLEDAHPALALRAPLGDVTDDAVDDEVSVVVAEEGPQLVDELGARRRAGAEHVGEPLPEPAAREEPFGDPAERAGEDTLYLGGPGGRGEQAAVEEADRLDDRALLAGARTIFVARCELLGDGVAVVVREDVDAVDAELGEELLVKRRLVHDRVGVAARLVRPAEADHVRRHDAEAGDELGPHGVPVPRRARETMDREERRPLALGAVEDGMSLVLERSSLLPPPLEIFAHGGTILLGLGTTLS